MRIRRKPEAIQILQEHPLVYQDSDPLQGEWHSIFDNNHPKYVELGTGKGQFLAKASELHPKINWIGVEKIQEPLLHAVRKGEATNNPNLRYLWMDIEKLSEVFAKQEVDRFYLHFSDPWPKARHAKRRLTNRRFLNVYKHLLSPAGDLILKTDSLSLFEFSLEEFQETGWSVIEISRDLHHSSYHELNITTEYEEKFASQGMPIYYVKVKPINTPI
ncbi:tRNA (guanosine(46)-N7)-methyltransferase TrmB [Hazenella coriacea]|uniref:tRNA (guanine-N(7)-)-methyltransferase n=1 Tax=Hazenella coriacea TaxID=1179467 RepID=A0A4R3L6K5_9BACL|nr:tRNA (guanosine(46)-N7)-methyltransferase TrmB [Hazenella coriacea]TCS95052.1 tRNA (guanine-N7-)-methyltransferase [Hazenella coriacea]